MTQEEYIMAKHWCYVRCTPTTEERCKICPIYKAYKEIYKEE